MQDDPSPEHQFKGPLLAQGAFCFWAWEWCLNAIFFGKKNRCLRDRNTLNVNHPINAGQNSFSSFAFNYMLLHMQKRSWFLVLVLLLCLNPLYLSAEDSPPPPPPPPSNERYPVDIQKPDLLIVSQSSSQFFRDMLKLPLLRDLLTEDFAFYYEQRNDAVLSFSGAMKRIAFEHEMSALDRFVAFLFNSPVEAAFWKGYDGKLSQFVIAMDRSLLKNLVEYIAKASASDTQLKALPERILAGGEKAQVYQVELSGKSVYFASTANKFFLYSKESMPLPSLGAKKWSETLTSLIGVKSEVGFFSRLLGRKDTSPAPKHSILLSARYLTFGYSQLFPGFRALGIHYSANGWSSSVLVDGKLMKDAPVATPWALTPKSPSLCVSLPLSVSAAAAYLEKLDQRTAEIGRKVLADMSSSVGACWYPESRFFTPLFLFSRKGENKLRSEDWAYAFQRIVGAMEVGKKRSEKTLTKQEGGILSFTRGVGSRFGTLPTAKSPNRAELASKRYFPVTLVIADRAVAFSPDAALAKAAGDTIAKRAPSLKETVRGSDQASLLVSPGALTALFRSAILDSLPASQESLFRASVASYLFPSFDKMKKHPDYLTSVRWGGSDERWEVLEWRTWR